MEESQFNEFKNEIYCLELILIKNKKQIKREGLIRARNEKALIYNIQYYSLEYLVQYGYRPEIVTIFPKYKEGGKRYFRIDSNQLAINPDFAVYEINFRI